jgi:hypothetical protein
MIIKNLMKNKSGQEGNDKRGHPLKGTSREKTPLHQKTHNVKTGFAH